MSLSIKKYFSPKITSSVGSIIGFDNNWTQLGNNIYNNNLGNVGIRNTSPQASLDISGSLIVRTRGTSLNILNPGTFGVGPGVDISNIPINNQGGFHTIYNGLILGTDGGSRQIVIGGSVTANTPDASNNICIGYSSATNGAGNIAIGRGANTNTGNFNIAIGFNASCISGNNQLSIGMNANSSSTGGLYGTNVNTNNFRLGVNNKDPASTLDVNGNSIRIRTQQTPSGLTGAEGEISWDNNYIYVRTSTGWKRINLNSF